MKILHVVATADAVTGGGLIERTRHLAMALTDLGAECAVLTLDIGLTEARRGDFAHLNVFVAPCLNRRFYFPRIGAARLASIVGQVDIVELTGHWTVLNAIAYGAARRLGIPHLVRPVGALGLVGRSASMKRLYNLVVGRQIVRRADGHIAVTPGEGPQFLEYGIGEDRLTVIPNGIDVPDTRGVDPRAFRARFGLEDKRLILYVGRLGLIKGPDLLLEAFADIAAANPNYDLVFAGPDDGLLGSLQRAAAERGIASRVRFVGYVGGVEKEEAYLACDFLALPSRREAMSLVALEAAVRGKPVLLTDQCGFDDVEGCGGGRVVEATVPALRQGLLEMVSQQSRWQTMGLALQAHVRRRYTWRAAAETFLDLCETTVRESRRRRVGTSHSHKR